ncbi:MAG TPA: hypothetical protein VJB67_00650 [Patescibacteria group bacterium]|nr:hypothetical protein [Patescibacteria group bacterium]
MNQNLYVKNPRIIDLIIKYSGGLIKSPKQASILLIVISIVVIAISVVIVANTINEKNIDYPLTQSEIDDGITNK